MKKYVRGADTSLRNKKMYVKKQKKKKIVCYYATDQYSDTLLVVRPLNLGKVFRIKEWFSN